VAEPPVAVKPFQESVPPAAVPPIYRVGSAAYSNILPYPAELVTRQSRFVMMGPKAARAVRQCPIFQLLRYP